MDCIRWTKDEIDFLRKNYSKIGANGVAEALGRSKDSVAVKASKLKIRYGRYFTSHQMKYIERNIGIVSYREMAKRTGHTYSAIRTYIYRNGLTRVSSDNDMVSVSEFARLVGCCKETVPRTYQKYGLTIYKAGKHTTVNMTEAAEWLRTHPERWDATRCQKWYFEKYPWFAEKHKNDFEKMIGKRWGK